MTQPNSTRPAAIDGRALARASMEKLIRSRGEELVELRRHGVDPKAAATPGAAPKPAALKGRALARAQMEKQLRAQGIEPVKR